MEIDPNIKISLLVFASTIVFGPLHGNFPILFSPLTINPQLINLKIQNIKKDGEKVIIVGAGLVGSLWAVYG